MKVKEPVTCRDLLYLNLFIIKSTLLNVYCSKHSICVLNTKIPLGVIKLFV